MIEGLEIVNFLIEVIIWGGRQMAYQGHWKSNKSNDRFTRLGTLFWKNFMKRNKRYIYSQTPDKATVFKYQRETQTNFKRM